MNNSVLIDFYLKEKRTEKDILSQIESIINLKVDSVNYPNSETNIFILLIDYTEGYKQGVSIMYPETLNISLNGENIAQKLSTKLNVSILYDKNLFESLDDEEYWLLITPNGSIKKVNIGILDDGIDYPDYN